MKKPIFLSIFFVLAAFIAQYLVVNIQKAMHLDAFSRRICANLIDAGYLLSDNECLISESIYEVMPYYFPVGEVTIDYVLAGMEGFDVLWQSSGTVKHLNGLCERGSDSERINYLVVDRPFLEWDDLYTFTFCNGILMHESV
jgi:hypothetical protein